MYHVFDVRSSKDWQLPLKSCLINFSVLSELCCPAPFRSFSVKYVSSGNEKYTVNGTRYQIKSGEYLLANHYAEGTVEIDKEVKGICIDVAPDMLSEVVASLRQPGTNIADISLDIFFNTPDFFENKYRTSYTHVGKFLKGLELEVDIVNGSNHCFSSEFYYLLAEQIVLDHVPVFKQLQNINTVKYATKKELLRRLTKGMDYINTNFKQPIQVAHIAVECGLSEYHFYRMFKSVFGCSPHQKIISNRLEFSRKLIKQKASVGEAALLSGFTDIYSFSKSYRKKFGVAPSSEMI